MGKSSTYWAHYALRGGLVVTNVCVPVSSENLMETTAMGRPRTGLDTPIPQPSQKMVDPFVIVFGGEGSQPLE